MKTTTYLIYEEDSGRVVHVHSEPSETDTKPWGIIPLLGIERDRKLNVSIQSEDFQEIGYDRMVLLWPKTGDEKNFAGGGVNGVDDQQVRA